MTQTFGILLGGIIAALLFSGCSGSSVSTESQSGRSSTENRDQFVTKRDTVEVHVLQPSTYDTVAPVLKDSTDRQLRTDSTSSRPHIFTIQVGAFENEGNARRWEEQAKDILKMPTYIEYDKRNKQFRVTIGTFATRESAFEVLKDLKQKYASMYRDAWVAESLRNQ